MALKPGDLVTPKAIQRSEQSLTELGVLDAAIISIVSAEIPSEIKNLKVRVVEGKPQYLELRGGIATIDGLRGGFEYGYRNLAGWALNSRLRARANYRMLIIDNAAFEEYYDSLSFHERIEWHALAGIGQVHFPRSRGLFGWNFDVMSEQDNEPAFSARLYSAFLTLKTSHGIGELYRRAVVVELRNGPEINKIAVLALQTLKDDEDEDRQTNPYYEKYLRMPEGRSVFWVTGLALTLDFRDHPLSPTKGVFITIGGDLVLSLGDEEQARNADGAVETKSGNPDYEERVASGELEPIDTLSRLIRTRATVSGYIPFGRSKFVLALSASFGYIFHLTRDSNTWADRYFYIGSVDTLRGFAEDSLVPEDIYLHWKSTLNDASDASNALIQNIGGQAMFILRTELRIPLPANFFGTLFGEMGNLWREPKQMSTMVQFDPLRINLRPVAGLGVRYMTPIGPLSFDLGFNLDKRFYEERLAWYFSIGSAF
jgi:outer membrane protein insertion porin family